MTGLMFQVSVTDPATFVLLSALLLLTTMAASYFPARRATQVDPIVALRRE
jgi:putative ABC transport system permease protein